MPHEKIKVYKGHDPYIFVSYAHKDARQVLPLLTALQDAGYRIWFDQGIEAGTEWSNNIAEHLSKCSGFLFFASANSVRSENCLDEIAFAKSYNKQALLVYLEDDVTLPVGADMQTARFQKLFMSRQTGLDGFVENFSEAAIFDVCRGEARAVSPAGGQSSPAKSKASLMLALGLGAAALALLAVFLLRPGDGNAPTATAPATTVTEPLPLALSDSLSDHTFQLEGVVYGLPVPFSRFAEEGWTLGRSELTTESYIGGHCKEILHLVNNGKSVSVTIYNDGENAKPLKDCLIGEISVGVTDRADFCIAAEVTPGITLEEAIAVYGVPSSRNDYSDHSLLNWDISSTASVKIFSYSGQDVRYSSISISNFVLSSQKVDPVETPPSFLDSYTAPTELGDDPFSGNVSLEGQLYTLPVPLREFLRSGWSLSSGVSAVASGKKETVSLSKDGKSLTVEVLNAATYKTLTQNCLVISLYVYQEDGLSLQLPGGLWLGMSGEDMISAVPDQEGVYRGSYSLQYNYSDYEDRTFYLHLTAPLEDNALTDVYISCYTSQLIPEN